MFGWLFGGGSKSDTKGKNGSSKGKGAQLGVSPTAAIEACVLNEFKQVDLPELDSILNYRFYGSLGMCMCLDAEIVHRSQTYAETKAQEKVQVSFSGTMKFVSRDPSASSTSAERKSSSWSLCAISAAVKATPPTSPSLSFCFKLKLPCDLPPSFLSSNKSLAVSYTLQVTSGVKPGSKGYVCVSVPVILPVSPYYSLPKPRQALDLRALPISLTLVGLHGAAESEPASLMTDSGDEESARLRQSRKLQRKQPQEFLYCDLHPPIASVPPVSSVSYNFVKSLEFDGLQDTRICVVSLSQTSFLPDEVVYGVVDFLFDPQDAQRSVSANKQRDPDASQPPQGGHNPRVLYCDKMQVKLEAVETCTLGAAIEEKQKPTELVKGIDSCVKQCRHAVNSSFEFRVPPASRSDQGSGFDLAVFARQFRLAFSFTLVVLTRSGVVQSHVTGVKLPLKVKNHGDSFN
jgi:hypothetical protein